MVVILTQTEAFLALLRTKVIPLGTLMVPQLSGYIWKVEY